MQIRICFILLMLLLTGCVIAQPLTRGETRHLHAILRDNLAGTIKPDRQSFPTEIILMVFATDSSGHIFRVSIMCDPANQDSAFKILGGLKPAHFTQWHSPRCKNRVIMVPVVSIGRGQNSGYTDTLFTDLFWANQNSGHVLRVYSNSILTNVLVFSSPHEIIEPKTQGQFVPIKTR